MKPSNHLLPAVTGILVAVLAAIAPLAAGGDRAAAAGAAWCLRGGESGAGGCSYYTFEQCQASRAGGSSFCTPNPFPSNPSGGERTRR